MNDIVRILAALDSNINVTESAPTEFTPTHFHKSNLGGKNKLMLHSDGKFYWQKRNNETGQTEIAKWNGNVNNRKGWNPASVDGEYINGKAVDYPEGVTFADKQKEKEISADDNISGSPTPMGAQGGNTSNADPDKLKLSDGSTFYFQDSGVSQTELKKKMQTMMSRYQELLGKVNESIPNSLKGYLSESDIKMLLIEALNDTEQSELNRLYKDLKAITDFKDSKGRTLLGDKNIALVKMELEKAPDDVKNGVVVSPVSGDAAQNKPGDAAASDAPNASNNQTAKVEPEKGSTAGSLEKFAKSGKGGIANDPDETSAIEELQKYLNDLGFDTGTPDGKYGPATRKGVSEFQKYFGAKVDGDAGPETIGQIIKLRRITFAGGKSFADFRRDMTRMEELVKKGGMKSTSAESMSFRDLINLVERSLTEALSDSEQKELADLLKQHGDIITSGEFAQALPKVSYDRYLEIWKAAKKFAPMDNVYGTDDGSNIAEPEAEPEAEPAGPSGQGLEKDGFDAAMAQVQPDTTAVGKTVEPRPTGSDQINSYAAAAWDKQYGKTHNADGTPKSAAAAPTVTAQANKVENMPPPVDEKSALAVIMASEGLADDMMKYLTPEEQAIFKQAIADAKTAPAAAPPASTARPRNTGQNSNTAPQTSAANVLPRPKQPGRGGVIAGQKWDKKYGKTHNADGTPKGK